MDLHAWMESEGIGATGLPAGMGLGAGAENPIEIVAAKHPQFAQQESAPLAQAGGGGLRWGVGIGTWPPRSDKG